MAIIKLKLFIIYKSLSIIWLYATTQTMHRLYLSCIHCGMIDYFFFEQWSTPHSRICRGFVPSGIPFVVRAALTGSSAAACHFSRSEFLHFSEKHVNRFVYILLCIARAEELNFVLKIGSWRLNGLCAWPDATYIFFLKVQSTKITQNISTC